LTSSAAPDFNRYTCALRGALLEQASQSRDSTLAHEEDEMEPSLRLVSVVSAAVVLSSLVGVARAQAQQQQIKNGVLSGEMTTLTAVVGPGSDVVLLSVPGDSNFVLTQVCWPTGSGSDFRLHNVGGGGDTSQATLDGTACREYTPGLVFYGGSDVVYRNSSASLTARAVVNGILTKK
jgi:hypothetical protein